MLLLVVGFVLAGIPAYILKWQGKNVMVEEKKTNKFTRFLFSRKRKGLEFNFHYIALFFASIIHFKQ